MHVLSLYLLPSPSLVSLSFSCLPSPSNVGLHALWGPTSPPSSKDGVTSSQTSPSAWQRLSSSATMFNFPARYTISKSYSDNLSAQLYNRRTLLPASSQLKKFECASNALKFQNYVWKFQALSNDKFLF